MKRALYVVLSLVAILLLYLRFSYGGSGIAAPVASPSSKTSIESPEPKVILSESIDNDYFTISYSPNATYSARTAPDSREWVISYRAEGDRPEGAINDGYLVSIMRFETNGDDSDQLQAEADQGDALESCSKETGMEIKEGKLGSLSALTFTNTCDSSVHYYVLLGDILYRTSVLVVGSDSSKTEYQLVTNTIINSLRFK